ncbi:SpaA isopeptide-forming pilin-related protein [Lactococcus formosensis]|uniref:SpaA isopeptide-forming pilin-related protein n=1 Tax=Lactococcus formosensis TaxID=1281486 RepID=UPI0039F6EFDE
MKRKLLSKVLNIAAIALLVAQIFPGSSLRAIADTLDLGGEPPSVNLTVAELDNEAEPEFLTLQGEVKESEASENTEITLSGADFIATEQEEGLGEIPEATYKVDDNKVVLSLTKASTGNFSLKLQIVKESITDGEIQVTLGDQVLTVPLKATEKEKAEAETEKTEKAEKAAATLGGTTPRERGLGLSSVLPTAGYPWSVISGSKVADPATDDVSNIFSNLPAVDDGRVWTDKTVRTLGGATDFEVTLSALSQSVPTREGYQIPADTVFTIDVSGSMTKIDPGAGRSRIALLVDALNEAIGILQDANPLNRVSVVAYGGRTGGYARVQKVLDLGRYAPNGSGNFFTLASSGDSVNVNATAAGEGAIAPPAANIPVVGSTPTQWGIRESARILENASNKQVNVPVTDTDGNVTEEANVTRRPNMILLTDGEPTMGRPDYAFDSSAPVVLGPNGNRIDNAAAPGQGPFYGDGSYGEQGLAVMTALTAAYRKTTILDAYFSAPSEAEGQPAADVGFFTISTGVQPTESQRNLINATLNPIPTNTDKILPNIRHSFLPGNSSYLPGPTVTTPSMTTLLNNFASGTTGNFLAQYRESFGGYRWNQPESTVNIANTTPSLTTPTDLAYADDFFEVSNIEDLREAFQQITNSIQETSNKPIVDGEAEGDLGSDSLDFSDVLGDYMNFTAVKNITFAGKGTYSPSPSVPTDFAETLAEYVRGEGGENGVALTPSSVEVAAILATFDNGRFTYYADNYGHYRDATDPSGAALRVEVYPFQQATVNSEVSGSAESISRLFFSVNTALSDTTVETDYGIGETGTRDLQENDQFVHWGIPSELLPMRTVSANNGSTTVSGDQTPIQVKFEVALDEARLLTDFNADRASVPANFWSNDWIMPATANDSFATFEPSEDNPFYQNVEGSRVVNKTQNPTASDGWVSTQSITPDPTRATGDNIVVNTLGNNGTFQLQYQGQVQIQKEFIFQGQDGTKIDLNALEAVLRDNSLNLAPLHFEVRSTGLVPTTVGTATIDLNDGAVLDQARANDGRVTLTLLDTNGQPMNLQPGVYMVTETGGNIESNTTGDNYIHVPGATTQRVTVPPGGTGVASFVNLYAQVADTQLLRVQKVFHGLDTAALAQVEASFAMTITAKQAFSGDEAATLEALNFTLNADGFYERRLSYADAIAGVNFAQIPLGDYEITETGMDVEGYNHRLAHWRFIDLDNPANAGESGEDSSTSHTVTVGEDSQIVFRFDNYYEPLGSIDLTKNFEGVTFNQIPEDFYIEITKDDDPDFDPIRIERGELTGLTTNEKISDLLPGEYTIKEYNYEIEGRNFEGNAQVERDSQATPEGQQPTYKVTIPGLIGNNDVTVNIYNRYLQGAAILPPVMVYPVQLKKVDQHDQGVAGAIFRLEKRNPETNRWETYLANLTSNAEGFVNTSVGEPGDYRFVETKAPDGFDMADNPISNVQTIVDGGVGTNDNPVYFGEIENHMRTLIQLKKVDEAGNPLAGAVFKVEFYNNGTWETIETGLTSTADGLVRLDVEEDGRYRFIETQAPANYVLDTTPKEVTVVEGQQAIFEAGTLENRRVEGPNVQSNAIQLLKVDEQNHELAGADFKVEAYNAESQTWELLVDNLQSGADGLVTTNVPGPGRYRFIETQAPNGYVLDETPKEVTVEEGVTGVIDAGKLINKSRANLPIVGDNLGLWLLVSGIVTLLGASLVLMKKKKLNL